MSNIIKTIKLESEKSYTLEKGKQVEVKTSDGESMFIRNDLVGLQRLLGYFDPTKHTVKDWKMMIKLRDLLTDAYLRDKKELELSLDEAVFLKDFMKELIAKNNKDSKTEDKDKIQFREFEFRTLLAIDEQFGE